MGCFLKKDVNVFGKTFGLLKYINNLIVTWVTKALAQKG